MKVLLPGSITVIFPYGIALEVIHRENMRAATAAPVDPHAGHRVIDGECVDITDKSSDTARLLEGPDGRARNETR